MKLLLIEWVDSHWDRNGWQELTDYKTTLPVMKSVGYVIFEDEQIIALCANIGEETEHAAYQGNGIMTLPKSAIVNKTELK